MSIGVITIKMIDSDSKPSQQEVSEVKGYVSSLLKTLECPICLDVLVDPIYTTCHHVFCRKCIQTVLQRKFRAPCPMCMASITKSRSLREKPRFREILQAVKSVVESVKEDCGIDVSPPKCLIADCSSPEGRSSMLAFKLTHPSPNKPTKTTKKATAQVNSDSESRRSKRKSTGSVDEDPETTCGNQHRISTNTNIQSGVPFYKRLKSEVFEKDHNEPCESLVMKKATKANFSRPRSNSSDASENNKLIRCIQTSALYQEKKPTTSKSKTTIKITPPGNQYIKSPDDWVFGASFKENQLSFRTTDLKAKNYVFPELIQSNNENLNKSMFTYSRKTASYTVTSNSIVNYQRSPNPSNNSILPPLEIESNPMKDNKSNKSASDHVTKILAKNDDVIAESICSIQKNKLFKTCLPSFNQTLLEKSSHKNSSPFTAKKIFKSRNNENSQLSVTEAKISKEVKVDPYKFISSQKTHRKQKKRGRKRKALESTTNVQNRLKSVVVYAQKSKNLTVGEPLKEIRRNEKEVSRKSTQYTDSLEDFQNIEYFKKSIATVNKELLAKTGNIVSKKPADIDNEDDVYLFLTPAANTQTYCNKLGSNIEEYPEVEKTIVKKKDVSLMSRSSSGKKKKLEKRLSDQENILKITEEIAKCESFQLTVVSKQDDIAHLLPTDAPGNTIEKEENVPRIESKSEAVQFMGVSKKDKNVAHNISTITPKKIIENRGSTIESKYVETKLLIFESENKVSSKQNYSNQVQDNSSDSSDTEPLPYICREATTYSTNSYTNLIPSPNNETIPSYFTIQGQKAFTQTTESNNKEIIPSYYTVKQQKSSPEVHLDKTPRYSFSCKDNSNSTDKQDTLHEITPLQHHYKTSSNNSKHSTTTAHNINTVSRNVFLNETDDEDLEPTQKLEFNELQQFCPSPEQISKNPDNVDDVKQISPQSKNVTPTFSEIIIEDSKKVSTQSTSMAPFPLEQGIVSDQKGKGEELPFCPNESSGLEKKNSKICQPFSHSNDNQTSSNDTDFLNRPTQFNLNNLNCTTNHVANPSPSKSIIVTSNLDSDSCDANVKGKKAEKISSSICNFNNGAKGDSEELDLEELDKCIKQSNRKTFCLNAETQELVNLSRDLKSDTLEVLSDICTSHASTHSSADQSFKNLEDVSFQQLIQEEFEINEKNDKNELLGSSERIPDKAGNDQEILEVNGTNKAVQTIESILHAFSSDSHKEANPCVNEKSFLTFVNSTETLGNISVTIANTVANDKQNQVVLQISLKSWESEISNAIVSNSVNCVSCPNCQTSLNICIKNLQMNLLKNMSTVSEKIGEVLLQMSEHASVEIAPTEEIGHINKQTERISSCENAGSTISPLSEIHNIITTVSRSQEEAVSTPIPKNNNLKIMNNVSKVTIARPDCDWGSFPSNFSSFNSEHVELKQTNIDGNVLLDNRPYLEHLTGVFDSDMSSNPSNQIQSRLLEEFPKNNPNIPIKEIEPEMCNSSHDHRVNAGKKTVTTPDIPPSIEIIHDKTVICDDTNGRTGRKVEASLRKAPSIDDSSSKESVISLNDNLWSSRETERRLSSNQSTLNSEQQQAGFFDDDDDNDNMDIFQSLSSSSTTSIHTEPKNRNFRNCSSPQMPITELDPSNLSPSFTSGIDQLLQNMSSDSDIGENDIELNFQDIIQGQNQARIKASQLISEKLSKFSKNKSLGMSIIHGVQSLKSSTSKIHTINITPNKVQDTVNKVKKFRRIRMASNSSSEPEDIPSLPDIIPPAPKTPAMEDCIVLSGESDVGLDPVSTSAMRKVLANIQADLHCMDGISSPMFTGIGERLQKEDINDEILQVEKNNEGSQKEELYEIEDIGQDFSVMHLEVQRENNNHTVSDGDLFSAMSSEAIVMTSQEGNRLASEIENIKMEIQQLKSKQQLRIPSDRCLTPPPMDTESEDAIPPTPEPPRQKLLLQCGKKSALSFR